jgi:hypothetical protein
MKEFVSLNKEKLTYAFKLAFVCFAIICSVLYFAPVTDKPGWPLFLLYDLPGSLVLASLLTGVIFLNGFSYYRAQEKLFNNQRLADLFSKYDFKTGLVNTHTKWHLTQTLKTGRIDSYKIMAYKAPGKRQSINVAIEVGWTEIEDRQIRQYRDEFRPYKAIVGPGAILKTIRCSGDIEDQVNTLLAIAKGTGLKPGKLYL